MSLVIVEVGWNSDDGVDNLLSKVALGDVSHLSENHGRDLFRGEGSVLASHLDGDRRLVVAVGNTEWEVFSISLDILVGVLAPDQSSGSRQLIGWTEAVNNTHLIS